MGETQTQFLENKWFDNQKSQRKDDIKIEYISHRNIPAINSRRCYELVR
jgi:hypothetical protein